MYVMNHRRALQFPHLGSERMCSGPICLSSSKRNKALDLWQGRNMQNSSILLSSLFHLFSSEFAFSCPGLWISVVALALICLLKSKRSFNIMMCSKGSRLTTFVSAGPAKSTTFLPWTLRSCILLKWVHRCCSQTKTETRHSGILWLSCSGEYWIDPWAWNCKPLKVN